ncbi:DsbE family thiol:disulfide interchange protein [Lutibaculum baratangense]|uniref:Cytochrome c-type biogenesis protein CcmG/DsbE, thiol:disulfide oxidoreductase n=1 Tax=Lutibaculum baratangense AMV1 TaxID=631454 RepID=V4RIQ3_9HYPH|nr:DsbE family thiol:disulfide interchange protein [Lutibaculum baratangense]ESR25966.1 Cytochrome c-type biogenesis protein CcmG/DsbE, thiol:disulfide oxidoreductase [Lutibaculum baratangense AMV1]
MTDTTERSQTGGRRWILRVALIAPLAVFLGLAGLFYVRLYSGDPSVIPSALIGNEVPQFELAALPGLSGPGGPVPGFSSADLRQGEVSIVNVWASWCVPCRDEHPIVAQLAEDGRFRVYGLNYKDRPENARRFLGQLGNPFDAVGVDGNGRVGIDWGVYGVPETFVVDGRGRITYKHVGPLTPQSLEQRLMPEIEKALSAS